MIKQKLLLIFLIPCRFLIHGQVHKTDTVDYSFYFKTFVLDKITEGKSQRKLPIKYDGPLITYIYDGTPGGMDSKYATKNDTIITAEWDLDQGYSVPDCHTGGKVILNRVTNLITLEKYKLSLTGVLSKKVVRKFKIIKLTQSQLILLDFTYLEKSRLYYFK